MLIHGGVYVGANMRLCAFSLLPSLFCRIRKRQCPRLTLAGVGHIAFRRDVTSVRAYVRTCVCACVTFVTRFKFTCKSRSKFTSEFLLQLITFIPSGLES